MTRSGAYPAGGLAAGVPAWRWPSAGVRPVRVLCLALLGVATGNLGRPPVLLRGGPESPVLFNDLCVGAVLAVSALACLQARRLRVDGLVGVAALFAAVGIGAGLWAAQKYAIQPGELVTSYAYLARWAAYFGLYVCVLNVARDDDAPAIWAALETMVLAVAAFGVVQVFAFRQFAQDIYPAGPGLMTWDYQGRRLVSSLLDPNFAGMLIAIPLLVHVARLSYGLPVRGWKLALLAGALLMTLSRGAILAFAVGLLVIVAVRGVRRALVKAIGGALLLALPFLPALVAFAAGFNKFTIDGSAMARVQSWLRAFTVIGDNPLFGVGFNTYRYVQRAYGWAEGEQLATGLDGGLLFVTVLTGFVGLGIYLALLWMLVARCRRLWRDASAPAESRGLALGTAATTVALVLHSITVNSLLLPFLMEPLWLLAGLVYLHRRASRRARGVVPLVA